jgi:hypothetical protein
MSKQTALFQTRLKVDEARRREKDAERSQERAARLLRAAEAKAEAAKAAAVKAVERHELVKVKAHLRRPPKKKRR